MRTFLIFCLLFAFCWPVAVLALALYPRRDATREAR